MQNPHLFTALLWVLLSSTIFAGAQLSGNVSGILEGCFTRGPPGYLLPYLDTSFMGEAQTLQIGAVNFSYFRFGPLLPQTQETQGTPLVLIQGAGATTSDWPSHLLRLLANGREVVIFDNRGMGQSIDSDPATLTLQSYAESTLDLISGLGIESTDILGVSLGGVIAQTLLNTDFTGLVRRVVLVSTTAAGTGFFAPQDPDELGDAVSFMYPDTPAGYNAFCRGVHQATAMPDNEATPNQRLRQESALGTGIIPSDTELSENLPNLTLPVLVLHGAQDVIIPVESAQYLAANLPNNIYIEFADAGHGAVIQYASTFARSIAAFLDAPDQELSLDA